MISSVMKFHKANISKETLINVSKNIYISNKKTTFINI